MNALAIPVQLYTPFFALLAACHQTAAEVTSFCAQSAQEQPPGQWAAQVHALRAHVHVLRSTVAAQLDKVDALLAFCEEMTTDPATLEEDHRITLDYLWTYVALFQPYRAAYPAVPLTEFMAAMVNDTLGCDFPL